MHRGRLRGPRRPAAGTDAAPGWAQRHAVLPGHARAPGPKARALQHRAALYVGPPRKDQSGSLGALITARAIETPVVVNRSVALAAIAVVRHVDRVVPNVIDEIDMPSAGVVLATMPGPVAGLA